MIFILDTNVLSAIMGSRPVPEVAAWIARQAETSLFTAAVCQAEILSGIAILPESRRRTALEAYAAIFAARRTAGLSTPPTDLMIAAIARVRRADVATRDTGGFAGCGLTVVDPWAASPRVA